MTGSFQTVFAREAAPLGEIRHHDFVQRGTVAHGLQKAVIDSMRFRFFGEKRSDLLYDFDRSRPTDSDHGESAIPVSRRQSTNCVFRQEVPVANLLRFA